MMFTKIKFIAMAIFCSIALSGYSQIADSSTYLAGVQSLLNAQWPNNRTVNIVFHGHSVPSGYAKTPIVNTLTAYPHLTLCNIKNHYPYAVVNVIVTGIGGEQSEQGARRFKKDVLILRPDVLFIDYALNDRGIGLERARKAWCSMIEQALKKGIKVILFTPTPDLGENILDDNAPLSLHAAQIRSLAAKYHVGLVDSYARFRQLKREGQDLSTYMSQQNHPNPKGHEVVEKLIGKWLIPASTAVH
jgi:acyl-CoA thioesterase-1